MVYEDGTTNTIHPEVIEEEATVEIGDVHGIGDGKISVTVTSNIGIREVQYKVNGEAQDPIPCYGD